MPVYKTTDGAISAAYLGSTALSGIYLGATNIWPGLPTFLGSSGTRRRSASSPLSFTETVPAGTKLAIAWVVSFSSSGGSTLTGKIGATGTMTLKAGPHQWFTFQLGASYFTVFTLLNPPTGSQTIAITDSGAYGKLGCGMAYYGNCSSVGTPILANKAGGSFSHVVSSSDPSKLYVQGFANGGNNNGNLSAYNQTARNLSTYATGTSTGQAEIYGDAPGNGGDLTFSATTTDTGDGSDSIIIPIAA